MHAEHLDHICRGEIYFAHVLPKTTLPYKAAESSIMLPLARDT